MWNGSRSSSSNGIDHANHCPGHKVHSSARIVTSSGCASCRGSDSRETRVSHISGGERGSNSESGLDQDGIASPKTTFDQKISESPGTETGQVCKPKEPNTTMGNL